MNRRDFVKSLMTVLVIPVVAKVEFITGANLGSESLIEKFARQHKMDMEQAILFGMPSSRTENNQLKGINNQRFM